MESAKCTEGVKEKKKPSPGIKTKLIFQAMKMMHKKGWNSSPTETEYWKQNGWFEKNVLGNKKTVTT